MEKIIATPKQDLTLEVCQDTDFAEIFGAAFNLELEGGDEGARELFHECISRGASINEWYEVITHLDHADKAKLFYLMSDCHRDYHDALEGIEDLQVYSCGLEDAALEIYNEWVVNEIPERWQGYFDHASWANDLRCGGDLREFRFAGQDWTVSGD